MRGGGDYKPMFLSRKGEKMEYPNIQTEPLPSAADIVTKKEAEFGEWQKYYVKIDELKQPDNEPAGEEKVGPDRHIHERRGIVSISKHYLNDFVRHGVKLPPGYIVRDIREDYIRMTVDLLVYGPDLPECDPACEAPHLDVIYANGELMVRSWAERQGHDIVIKEIFNGGGSTG